MAVYVDQIVNYGESVKRRLGSARWCHMTADTKDELHEMADLIGLRRSWFQPGDGVATWHYDITPNKRAAAIRHGAVEVDVRQMGSIISSRRKSKGPTDAEKDGPSVG